MNHLILIAPAAFAFLLTTSIASDPFSFAPIERLKTEKCADAKFFVSSDGRKLAYFEYLPSHFDSVVVLIHGGGAYSCAGYQYLSRRLQDSGVAVYALDLRGHGLSEGPRGHTESTDIPFRDLTGFIQSIRSHSKGRLVLVGHSSGAGFLLNYSAFPERIEPNHYVFLAPEFGYKAETRKTTTEPFATPRLWVFIAGAFSGGRLFQETPAVKLHYPDAILKDSPLLLRYLTRNMALAVTASHPNEQLQRIATSTRILIGRNDEVIDAEKLVSFVEKHKVKVTILPDTTHLSILERVDEIRQSIVQ